MSDSHINTSPFYSKQLRKFGSVASVTLFALIVAIGFLIPFVYGSITAFKDKEQIVAGAKGAILPVDPVTFEYEGEQYEIFEVPTDDGIKEWALYKKGRSESTFIDPANPSEPIVWEGKWRTLEPVQVFSPRLNNFGEAWEGVDFPKLFRNTLFIAITGMIGTLMSSTCVAYAFARFPIPYKNAIFMILIATIVLPPQITLVPTYAFFSFIGWTGTWAPLIIPHFFANAYNVFLIRQYLMTIPREMDESAMIDGAGPFRVLVSIIVPQAWPVIVAAGLSHFVFAWNDYFMPLIYLLGKPELHPISVGIQQFNFIYDQQPHLIQATALLGLSLPVIIFFLAQRFFMRGVVFTGVEK